MTTDTITGDHAEVHDLTGARVHHELLLDEVEGVHTWTARVYAFDKLHAEKTDSEATRQKAHQAALDWALTIRKQIEESK